MDIGLPELLVVAFICVLLFLPVAVAVVIGILISRYKRKT